ncbi:MAG: chemotaxis protein CheD [Bryobacterales bacterium]|nr:chemotaxis protein CheD [Bryobacterales bacterium]
MSRREELVEKVVYVGEVFASSQPARVQTLLGSCVAACLYDEAARIGGLNHFLLPGTARRDADAARYGVHAMELLINRLMQLGAERGRLQAKVFGGANLRGFGSLRVGTRNREFVREFLKTEGIPIRAGRLGGNQPLQVRFYTETGRAMVRALGRQEGQLLQEVAVEERSMRSRLEKPLWEPDEYVLFEQ